MKGRRPAHAIRNTTEPPDQSLQPTALHSMHEYEVRPRKDKHGFDPIFDVLPFGALWYTKPDDAVSYAKFSSRSHDAGIRVYKRR
jgi:hypothetical protein